MWDIKEMIYHKLNGYNKKTVPDMLQLILGQSQGSNLFGSLSEASAAPEGKISL